MIRIIAGVLVIAQDDARITPELKDIRTCINDFLRWASTDSAETRLLREQFRTGRIGDTSFDWFTDHALPSSPEPSPSNPDRTAEGPCAQGTAQGDGDSPQGSETGSGTREYQERLEKARANLGRWQ